MCRVKVDEAGNRLTPEDTRITPIYIRVEFRVEGEGRVEDRRSLEVLSSKVASNQA